ncbi:MAG TPA: hypothetical protein VJC07_04945 [Candidatus Nanoarchaeia archaeon]|nr:hypothetical protein [Candidatus Nanoarchaeia archaeon]
MAWYNPLTWFAKKADPDAVLCDYSRCERPLPKGRWVYYDTQLGKIYHVDRDCGIEAAVERAELFQEGVQMNLACMPLEDAVASRAQRSNPASALRPAAGN